MEWNAREPRLAAASEWNAREPRATSALEWNAGEPRETAALEWNAGEPRVAAASGSKEAPAWKEPSRRRKSEADIEEERGKLHRSLAKGNGDVS